MANVKYIQLTEGTGDLSEWSATSGTVTVDTTSPPTGGTRSVKLTSTGIVSELGVLADAGRRITFYFKFDGLPALDQIISQILTAGDINQWNISLTTTGAVKIAGATSGTATSTTTLAANTWHRICISYTITSSTVNSLKLYLNGGAAEFTLTNSNIVNASSNEFKLFGPSSGSLTTTWLSNLFIDDGADLADPGNVRASRKKPAGTNTNNFDTTIGTTTNRYDYVNERPISESLGLEHAASTDVQENFTLDTQSGGDTDLTGATILGRTAWLWGKRGSNAGTVSFRTAHSANANNVAITTPASGDLILVMSYNNASTTIPTLAAGYTSIATANPGGSSNAARLAWKTSNGTETGSGTWTNATNVAVSIYRGTNGLSVGTAGTPGAGNSAALSYPTLAPSDSSGSSWVAGFGAAKAATAGMNGTTTNLTSSRTNQTTVNALDTNTGVTSFAAQTLNVTGSGRWITFSVEIVATAVSSGTPKIMDNGSETAITLTATSALYTLTTTSATYPSNAAGIGMRSSNATPDTFLYECGTVIAYTPAVVAPQDTPELYGRPYGNHGQVQMAQLLTQ